MSGITLGGIKTLLDPDHEIEETIGRRFREFAFSCLGDRFCELPMFPAREGVDPSAFASPYPSLPLPRVNEWIDPTGISRFGRGLFLVENTGMKKIAADAFGYSGDLLASIPASWGNDSNAVTLRFEFNGAAVERPVYPIAAFAVTHQDQQVWAVGVVDVRYRWLRELVEITEDDCDNWAALFTKLGGAIGKTISGAAVTALGVPDERSFIGQLSPAIAIDAAALSVCRRAVLGPNDTPQLLSATDSLTAFNDSANNLPRKIGGRSPNVRESGIRFTGPIANFYADDGDLWTQDEGPAAMSILTSFYKHTGKSNVTSASETAVDDYVAAARVGLKEWTPVVDMSITPGLRLFALSGHWDYVAFHVSGIDSIHTSAITLPPDFAPRFMFNQWEDNHVVEKMWVTTASAIAGAEELGDDPSLSGWKIRGPIQGEGDELEEDEDTLSLQSTGRVVDFWNYWNEGVSAHSLIRLDRKNKQWQIIGGECVDG